MKLKQLMTFRKIIVVCTGNKLGKTSTPLGPNDKSLPLSHMRLLCLLMGLKIKA
jgi:hypothetical protein